MTKRQHLTLDEVLDVLSDDEDDDDWDEPMEGSDDEFSDLEMYDSDEDTDAMDEDPATVPSRTATPPPPDTTQSDSEGC